MNVVSLIGRTARDPEIRYTSGSQLAVASFTIADDRGKDKDGKSKGTNWIRCKAFGKTAEVFEKYVCKGDQIGITGHIQTGEYKNKNGDTVYTTDVIVDKMDFCQKVKRQEEPTRETPPAEPEQIDGFAALDETEDDLPF